jgi:hypothetical protein
MAGNRAVTFTGPHRMEVQDERSPKKYVIDPHNVTEFAALPRPRAHDARVSHHAH